MARQLGRRHRARVNAMQILCALERQPDLTPAQAMALHFTHLFGAEGLTSATTDTDLLEMRNFVETLVCGTRGALPEVDRVIHECSPNWRLPRLGLTDRNVLRLACFELLRCPGTPVRVVCSEAVDLARRFGTTESGAFVNGVCDRMAKYRPRIEPVPVCTDEPTAPV